MLRQSPLLWSLLLCISSIAHAAAQNGGDLNYGEHSQAPRAVAVRAAEAPVIDGLLDDPVWQDAPVISGLYQIEPDEGQPVTERTEVRITYDDLYLYVGAWMYDTGPLSRRLGRRDSAWPDTDSFILFLDTYHDHRTAYRFTVNPSGTRRDEIITGGGSGGGPGGPGGGGGRGGGGPGGGGGGPAGTGFGDPSWDPVWQVETSSDGEGWYAELRIPFGQLRFRPAEQQTWGLQVDRRIGRRNEHATWAFTPRLERATVARFGHVEGIRDIRRSGPVELLPFIVTRAEYREVPFDAELGFKNPFRSGSDYFADAGLDLKYRVTSNITLDATINPDFGQVEIDPAEINLSAFETRFDERRPFFVDGAEIFQFGGGGGFGGSQILYTRRIGRSPQVAVPSNAVYLDVPGNSTILGATKLTGKTPSGWSLGVLDAVTNREDAAYVDELGERNQAVVEPLANYFVARARRDLDEGRTAFGVITTAVNRNLGDHELLTGRLPGQAYTGGVDFRHETGDRAWGLSGELSPSYVSGDPDAIVRLQRTSARYFQRPDATHLELDPMATSLFGYSGTFNVGKQSGAWRGSGSFTATSPGYEVNDIGFQTNADRLDLFVNGGFEETRPGDVLRRWSIRSGGGAAWNYGGDRVQSQINLFSNVQFLGYQGLNARIGYGFEGLNDRLTRGGPLTEEPANISGNVGFNTDNRRALTFRGGMGFNRDEAGGSRTNMNFNVGYRPTDAHEIQLGPNIGWNHTVAQYVGTIADPTAEQTFGRRYVFAPLDQTTVSMATRVNMTFSPNLTLEIYAEPFISTGRYATPRQLAEPRSFTFLEYGTDLGNARLDPDGRYTIDPDGPGPATSFRVRDLDFNFHSLLGNAVLRWEWRPGSTLFLVWQQSRTERLTAEHAQLGREIGDFDLAKDSRALLGLQPENILMVKINYWLNP